MINLGGWGVALTTQLPLKESTSTNASSFCLFDADRTRTGFPSHGGQSRICSHLIMLWHSKSDPAWGGGYRPGLPGPSPVRHPLGWATQVYRLSQSLISRIRQKSIIKEPSPSGGSLLVSTERQEYLADFFFHPANFSPLYNISFQYNPVSIAH